MSHNVAIKDFVIKDLDVLALAVAELGNGLRISDGPADARGYGGRTARYHRVIHCPKSQYDIGVSKVDGTEDYTLTYEYYLDNSCKVDGLAADANAKCIEIDGLKNAVPGAQGSGAGKLMQLYNIIAAEQQAIRQGYSTTRQNNPETGEMTLVVTGM